MDRFSAASSAIFSHVANSQVGASRPRSRRGSLAGFLRSGASHSALGLMLSLACGGIQSAHAAAYTASNEAELNAAIAAANASGDASSTIVLTGSFSITGTGLPTIAKTLTIDTGAYALSATGSETWDVGAGGTLTIEGASTAGKFIKNGSGVTVLDGVSGNQGLGVEVNAGTLRIEGGSLVSAGSSNTTSVVRISGGALVLSGAGTTLVGNAAAASGNLGGLAGASMSILDGAVFDNDGGFLMTTSSGTLSVSGANSLFEGLTLSIVAGSGVINVTDGGAIETGTAGVGGLGSNALSQAGSGTVTISGDGSRWTNANAFRHFRGAVNVLDGGALETGSLHIASTLNANSLVAGVLVSGEGSRLTTTSSAANSFQIASGNGAGTKSGALTIANEGTVTVGASGDGTIDIATSATSTGTINIGGATGQAAMGAGTLNAGVIQFGAGTGILNFNHTDASYGFDVAIASGTGTGTLNQLGSGKTVLTADQLAFTGQSNVLAGILEVNGILGGTMDVLGGRLQGTGTVGSTRNAAGGIIAPGNSIGTLTINGDYTSDGGALAIEAILGDDSSLTDMLVITGASILGTGATQVFVTNLGGAGAQTTGDGIKIVDVAGASDAGAFVLGAPAIGGAHAYDLFQNDLLGTLDDGDWYLRAAGLAPTIPVYENYPQVLLGMISLPTLEQRIGDRHRAAIGGGDANATGIWTRIEGAHGHFESGGSTSDASYDADTALVQAGLDAQLWQGASGVLVGGLTAQYMRASADISSSLGDGANDTDSYGIGATLTWYGQGGFYVDAQAQIASLDSDLSAAGVGAIGAGIDGDGYALSLEAGREIALGDTWSLTPQAQLAYASVDFDSFTDQFGADVSLKDGDSLKGRVGIAANYEAGPAGTKVYGIANLTYEFLDGTAVAVSGVDASFEPQRFGGELGLGGTYQWAGGKYALHGEVLASSSFEGSYGVKGTAGLAMKF